MKKIAQFLLLLSLVLILVGCGTTKDVEQEEVGTAIPQGAVLAHEGKQIKANDITLTLPDGMTYGQNEVETGMAYYAWKADTEFLLPSNSDVMFYMYEGEDNKSPDEILTESQARNSIKMGYIPLFSADVENSRVSIDENISSSEEWYVLCFTAYSGSDIAVTTYGTYCYPKTYYGIYLLQKNKTKDYSRRYYGFVFSNDANGGIFTQKEYESLFNQVKSTFGIETFFTMPQNPMNYDPTKDTANGYSYSQLETLFHDTKNYYIISNGGKEETVPEEIELSPLYDVVKVVDGDTLVVLIDGQEIKVRLIGVDTPESVNPDNSKNTSEGTSASEWLIELLTEKQVFLEYDVSLKDDYGRTLAYVYLDDGKTMVNRLLLENGLAQTMTIQPNSKYAEDFYAVQVAARVGKKGFWGTGFFDNGKEN